MQDTTISGMCNVNAELKSQYVVHIFATAAHKVVDVSSQRYIENGTPNTA
jgi:hypothetical protein